MADLRQVTDQTFQREVLDSAKPVLVDFWAPWCAPCKMIAPILEQIHAEHGDRLDVVAVNSDENPEVAAKYSVLNLPMLSVYVDGQVVKTIVGAKPKRLLLKDLQEYIGA